MKKIAIACQGGGSHTAFTAGVLSGLLTSGQHGDDFRIIALSGTSGGAICAGIAWSCLLHDRKKDLSTAEQQARGKKAAHTLEAFWVHVACEPTPLLFDGASSPRQPLHPHLATILPYWRLGPFNWMDALANTQWQLQANLNPLGESQCRVLSKLTRKRMEHFLNWHLPLTAIGNRNLLSQVPKLRVGAANICEGWSEPIKMEDHPAAEFHNVLLASASIPPLFLPTKVEHNWYWDGLFAHNPPVECLANPTDVRGTDRPDANDIPDEIWVIQVNPEKRAQPPRTAAQLVDRRNELIGNLTLYSELYHIDAMNWLIKEQPSLRKCYKIIKLRIVSLDEDLSYASKYDRSRELLDRLFRKGQIEASKFLRDQPEWSVRDAKGHPVQGVHMAARAGARVAGSTTDEPNLSGCYAPCAYKALCSAFPNHFDICQEELFDIGQRYFETCPAPG